MAPGLTSRVLPGKLETLLCAQSWDSCPYPFSLSLSAPLQLHPHQWSTAVRVPALEVAPLPSQPRWVSVVQGLWAGEAQPGLQYTWVISPSEHELLV